MNIILSMIIYYHKLGLKDLYKKKVLPLEIASKYSHFSSPPMGPSDFDAKPMVILFLYVLQY